MYTVNGQDEVVELAEIPPPDIGAPLPMVIADDHAAILCYLTREPDSSKVPPAVVIRFKDVWAQYLGAPNDEAFQGHPLADYGLGSYAAYEVLNSSWIQSLEKMNRCHFLHSSEMFENFRHFVFAFHDSTFECVAQQIEVCSEGGPLPSAGNLVELLD